MVGMKLPKLSRKKKILAAIAAVLVASGIVFMLTKDSETVREITNQPEKKYYSKLTGEEVSEEASEEPVLAVMIENSEEARPQTGLDAAGIVFETVTEGGITRYLALYQTDKPEEVGPVRSVRPAFVDWLMGFDAAVAHVGGSEQALQMLDNREDAKSLNQFYNDGPYYRRNNREAPHNMYARVKDLTALQYDKGYTSSDFEEFPRSDDAAAAPPSTTRVTLRFSQPVFTSVFSYDAASNRYLRSLAGAPHMDEATGKQISVKNLIVLRGDIQSGAVGNGQGQLFKDGQIHPITWRQDAYGERIQFEDMNGAEVSLNRGDSWIAVVPPSGSVGTE